MSAIAPDSAVSASFSQTLRQATREEHERAEGSAFVRDLMAGDVGTPGYAQLVAQHLFVYTVLEEAAEAMRADRVGGAFVFDALSRRTAIEHDLAVLLGDAWREQVAPLPATQAYCDRLREVAFTWAGGFVAHHYTRYLGDLSGGQIIKRSLARTGVAPPGSTTFYEFDAITDRAEFKREYRRRLDAVPFDAAEQRAVADEASEAFRLNRAMFDDLALAAGDH